MMDVLSKELTACGFIVYPNGDNFVMTKVATPLDNRVSEPKEYNTYEDAVLASNEFYVFREYNFTAIVRYNRGLGIEYKNISKFSAFSKEEAEKTAWKKAEIELGIGVDIREVRIRIE